MKDTVGSNVITTSLAMGLAMVVSDVGSIRDYCDKTNTLFCKNNAEDFVNALNTLKKDPLLVSRMQNASIDLSQKLKIENVDRWFSSLSNDDLPPNY